MTPPSPRQASEPNRSPESSSRRLLGLDLLRFIAVCLVIGRHITVDTGETSFSASFLVVLQRGAWIGVDLFFVLSGFLVSGLLFQEHKRTGDVRIGRFLIRRGWKIYPAFWFMIAFSLALYGAGWWHGFSRRGLLGEMLFLQNYVGTLWFQTWSLAVEEHFYLLLAFAVWWMVRHGRRSGSETSLRRVPLLFVGVAVSCQLLRILTWRHYSTFDATHLIYQSHLRLDSLMYGVLLSYAWHVVPGTRFRELSARWRGWLIALGAACLAPAFRWNLITDPWLSVFGVVVVYVGAGLILLGLLNCEWLENSRVIRVIAWLGSRSYSTYLWHGMWVVLGIPAVLKALGTTNPWVELGVGFVGTWFLGVVTAALVEFPVLRLRERFIPSTRSGTSVQPSGTRRAS